MSASGQSSPVPAKPKKQGSNKLANLRAQIVRVGPTSRAYICDYTMANIVRRAFVPHKKKDGSWERRGAFLDWNTVLAYLADQRDAGNLSDESFAKREAELREYLEIGPDAGIEIPTIRMKDLRVHNGSKDLGDYVASYKKRNVERKFYRTIEQDEEEAQARRDAKKEEPNAKPARLSVYSNGTQVGAVNAFTELLTMTDDEKQRGRALCWQVAVIPAEAGRFAAMRVPLEKDSDLLAAVATGLQGKIQPAGLPTTKKAGRAPLLVVPRATKLDSVATQGSPSSGEDSSPPVAKKRKASASAAETAEAPLAQAATAEGAAPKKPRKSKKAASADSSPQSSGSAGSSPAAGTSPPPKPKKKSSPKAKVAQASAPVPIPLVMPVA